ncbi:hypothetical protein LY76DRAFT_69450 [Colletotrichum caudatum]|nr:hypothetical protein LY76DRAFT_69450 [Colletotrichum caudatum]
MSEVVFHQQPPSLVEPMFTLLPIRYSNSSLMKVHISVPDNLPEGLDHCLWFDSPSARTSNIKPEKENMSAVGKPPSLFLICLLYIHVCMCTRIYDFRRMTKHNHGLQSPRATLDRHLLKLVSPRTRSRHDVDFPGGFGYCEHLRDEARGQTPLKMLAEATT